MVTSISLVLVLVVVFVIMAVSQAKWQSFCPDYARNFATYSKSRVQSPPNPVGRWSSESCEVTPGPHFILRHINIQFGTRWQLALHHYEDSWCTSAVFTIVVNGVYSVNDELNSVRGSYNSNFGFDSIVLIPHNVNAMADVLTTVGSFCSNAGLPSLSDITNPALMKRNYTVGKEAMRRRECREALGLHFYSYKIIRHVTQVSSSNLYDQLYFGELPTHLAKKTFSSTALQLPLRRSNAPGCDVCRRVKNSTPTSPPMLRPDKRQYDFSGAWVSTVCEVQSDLFMTRYLNFDASKRQRTDKSQWQLEYHYFVDTNCNTLSYVISAEGNFTHYSASRSIDGASNYVFELTHLKITPMEELIVTFLRTADEGTCGNSRQWRLGVEQDVTPTGGCSAFGLKLPSLDYDVVKVIRQSNGLRRLYTGQRPTDASVPDTPNKRPTSFQIPLRRCSDVTRGITPITTPIPTERRTIMILKPDFTISPELLGRRFTMPVSKVKSDNSARARNNQQISAAVHLSSVRFMWTCAVLVICAYLS